MSVAQARKLRRTMTDVERKLWNVLRGRQLDSYKFRRQHPIGPYVLDFFCEQLGLAIELDGDQHGDPANVRKDTERSEWLNAHGVRVIRFWNADLRGDINPALDIILDALRAPALPQPRFRRVPPSS
jgi:very-short-patch-repair endonuclease